MVSKNVFSCKKVIIIAITLKSALIVLTSVLVVCGKPGVFLLPDNNFVAAYVPGGELRLVTNVLGPANEY